MPRSLLRGAPRLGAGDGKPAQNTHQEFLKHLSNSAQLRYAGATLCPRRARKDRCLLYSAAESHEMKKDPSDPDLVVVRTARFDERGVVITVEGELDLATHDQLGSAIADELAAACNRLVIDFSGTAFIGSTAMGVLLQGVAALRDDGTAAVVLVTAPGITRRALEVSGVLALFSAYDTREDAIAAVHADRSLSAAWRHLRPAARDARADLSWPTNGHLRATPTPSRSTLFGPAQRRRS